MTYEDKMLEIFARYRGESLSPRLVKAMEQACQEEVWRHLPDEILQKWELRLGIDDAGQLELRPKQLKAGGAQELEQGLRSPFREKTSKPSGGIASVSMNFMGHVAGDSKPGEVSRFSVGGGTATTESDSTDPRATSSAPTEGSAPGKEAPASGYSAGVIEAQAAELGISLPKNASLLGPFLEALETGVEYKRRAEAAEKKLAELAQLAGL